MNSRSGQWSHAMQRQVPVSAKNAVAPSPYTDISLNPMRGGLSISPEDEKIAIILNPEIRIGLGEEHRRRS